MSYIKESCHMRKSCVTIRRNNLRCVRVMSCMKKEDEGGGGRGGGRGGGGGEASARVSN